MSGLTLSPLIGKSYSSIYGQTAPSNKVKVASSDAVAWDTGI